MSDTERGRKPHFGRRNPPSRPPPGVQKAIHNFGVRDLRQILDKKHQEHGESPNDTQKKLPPPDPSYNYLKDPARDRSTSPPHRREPKKQTQQLYQNPKLSRSKTDPNIKNEDSPQPRNIGSTFSQKKELRFLDTPKSWEGEQQNYRGGRGSFRGRGRPRRSQEGRAEQFQKIENPVNIKIQLSTETGRRSYVLDESTKIADIKHVPDNSPSARPWRGAPRGGRSNFRGRSRGRGSFRGRGRPFRGRGGYNKGDEQQNFLEADYKNGENELEQFNDSNDNEFSGEYHEQQPDDNNKYDEENAQNDKSGFDPNLDKTITITSNDFSSDTHEQQPDDNNKYDEEGVNEENAQNDKSGFDPNLDKTITITSSNLDDGDTKRSVDIKGNEERC